MIAKQLSSVTNAAGIRMTALLLMLAAAAGGCGDKPNQTAMTMCQKAVATAADAEMDRVWAQVRAVMQAADRSAGSDPVEGGNVAALLVSQRAWLAFRNAECKIKSYEWRGGTMQPFTENQCLTQVTRSRTQQLRAMLSWQR